MGLKPRRTIDELIDGLSPGQKAFVLDELPRRLSYSACRRAHISLPRGTLSKWTKAWADEGKES